MRSPIPDSYWAVPLDDLFAQLNTTASGLSDSDAKERLQRQPRSESSMPSVWRSLAGQFANPIQLLLIGAAILSAVLGDFTDSLIIAFILVAGALLSFQQEFRAGNAVADLMKLVETKCRVRRDSAEAEVPLNAVVPGDIVLLSAGSMVPGDGVLLESDSLYLDQASLTGESFPVEKQPGAVAADASLENQSNCVFAGTHVISGSGAMLVVETGSETKLGHVAGALAKRRPDGEFQRGLRRLGGFLIQLTIFMTLLVFAVNVYLQRPFLDSFMFSLALAVGLTPQLLPAVVSLNLSRGATQIAKDKVIVKRLASIENFGSMEVLCSDKTGTLTEGVVKVAGGFSANGSESPEVLELATLNALLESGYANPIDVALRQTAKPDALTGVGKLGELPYDFYRKRLSILVSRDGQNLLITKGALESVLDVCTVCQSDGGTVPISDVSDQILEAYKRYGESGYRALGVATRTMPGTDATTGSEREMVLRGFILLEDPLRPESAETVATLKSMGISLKMITGDNRHVAARMGNLLGLSDGVLTGSEIAHLSDSALTARAGKTSIFAEIEPNQKERIILAMRKGGAVVGYIGDGINDGAALHAADAGISVANAVDVAKEAADFVMLEPNLGVLVGAVNEGRKTFVNTFKYIFMATSANFGNMFSLAGATLLVPFLPLLAKQVLLTNLLTDLPEMAIPGDNIDPEVIEVRQRWDMGFLTKFMVVFGFISSFFDFATFLVLLSLKASPEAFRTGWFTESVISATLVVLVVRSRRWMFSSKPSAALRNMTLLVGVVVLTLPYTPVAKPLGLAPLPLSWLAAMLGIVAVYVCTAEIAKHAFFAKLSRRPV